MHATRVSAWHASASTGVEDARTRGRDDDRKAPAEVPEKPRDLAAGELEFTDDKVRVGYMFSLLLINFFVGWGNGGGAVP